jgi:hypothetical protein
MEEEGGMMADIYAWALGSDWMDHPQQLDKSRNALWKAIEYRAMVTRECCEEVCTKQFTMHFVKLYIKHPLPLIQGSHVACGYFALLTHYHQYVTDYNLNNIRYKASRHFRNKKEEISERQNECACRVHSTFVTPNDPQNMCLKFCKYTTVYPVMCTHTHAL